MPLRQSLRRLVPGVTNRQCCKLDGGPDCPEGAGRLAVEEGGFASAG